MNITLDERTRQANMNAKLFEEEERKKIRLEREAEKMINKQRNYILGEYVSEYFPEVLRFEPGKNKGEHDVEFRAFTEALSVLSADQKIIDWLRGEVKHRLSLTDALTHQQTLPL